MIPAQVEFFHDTYKKRDSAEIILDAALGRTQLSEDAPRAEGGNPNVRITAALHGGRGTLRQGIVRHLVVRFDLDNGLHIYGEPVPEGMVATQVVVNGPPGLVVEPPILPPSEPLTLASMGIELQVWSGTVDIRIPIYPTSELASEVRPLDHDKATIDIQVRYQACDDRTCLLPQTERFVLDVPLDVTDVPAIAVHMGHGQREGNYDGNEHFKHLLKRKKDGAQKLL